MKRVDWLGKTSGIGASFLLAIGIGGWLAPDAQAQFTSPPGQGMPKGTAGGGSRPIHLGCLQQPNSQEHLVAMAPTQSLGLTSSADVAVWVYLPNTTAKTLEFSLFTQESEGVYQTNVPIKASGLLKLAVPSKIVALQAGKSYYWSVALVCNPKRRTDDWLTGGWIQHQPLSTQFQHQLTGATLEQKVGLYAKSGFWYEALNTYLTLRQRQPNHPGLPTLWADLVQGAGLNAIVPEAKRLRLVDPAPTQAHR